MDQHSNNINSSCFLHLSLSKPFSQLSLPLSSLTRLKNLTQQISRCCDSLSNTRRKRSSLYQRIQSYQSTLIMKVRKQQEQQLLKEKLVVYKKQLGRMGQQRKDNIKDLLKSWSQPRDGRSVNSSIRLNLVNSRHKRFQNLKKEGDCKYLKTHSKAIHSNISYVDKSNVLKKKNLTQNSQNNITITNLINNTNKSSNHSKFIPRKSKFSSNLLFIPSSAKKRQNKQNKENKLLGLFHKAPSKLPTRTLFKTHSPQHKNNSFMLRRSNAYSVILQRGRSITRELKQYPSPKEIFKIQALQHIDKIMSNLNLGFRDKINKLMEIKIKMNNLESDQAKHGDVGRRVKECILELYNSVINEK